MDMDFFKKAIVALAIISAMSSCGKGTKYECECETLISGLEF